jgi:serine/threonine protein kinase
MEITEGYHALRLLAAELTLGLLFLHEHGIVHQDIKPSNIMISSEGHIVIGEFRAAIALPCATRNARSSRLLSSLSNLPDISASKSYSQIVRQPADTDISPTIYSAPELYQTKDDQVLVYDERVDFWSLGILLYEVSLGNSACGEDDEDANIKDANTIREELEKLSIATESEEGHDAEFADFLSQASGKFKPLILFKLLKCVVAPHARFL